MRASVWQRRKNRVLPQNPAEEQHNPFFRLFGLQVSPDLLPHALSGGFFATAVELRNKRKIETPKASISSSNQIQKDVKGMEFQQDIILFPKRSRGLLGQRV